jgi:chromosome segregation protein
VGCNEVAVRIKQLELTGFKSFLDKTKFEFNAPITTIVGPNGCGKSNVVDALKWISGELSYKELRGRSMEDLIFAGSDRRAPTSMMEVSLVLDNQEKTAPAQYNQYDEITLQRRIFRDGSSEFYINKIPCRLRDITDMFLDTGIGQSSYSIIEQGKVGAIVSGRPEDRRLMIEEAAGITKYKSRKKAAERKIDYTKQNLLRVSDIINELKKQIASLERQAKKAEDFRKAQDKAKEVDLSISGKEYEILQFNSNEAIHRETQHQDLLSQEETNLAQEESVFETRRVELDGLEKTFQSSQQDLFSIKSVIQQINNQIESHQRDLARLQETSREEKTKDQFLDQELIRLEQKIQNTKEQVAQLEQENETLKAGVTERQQNCAASKTALTTVETELDALKGAHIDAVTREARLNSTIASNQNQLKSLEEELSQLNETSDRLTAEISEKQTQYAAQKISVDESSQLSFGFQESKKATQATLAQLEEAKVELEKNISETQKKLDSHISKLHALQEFARTYQGYTKSVQSVMSKREEFGNIHGVLGEMVKPKKGYEKAVQAALSELIECILVDQPEDAMKAISYLKNEEKNRGLFMASNGTKRTESARVNHPKVLGSMLDFVEIHPSLNNVVGSILTNTYVVDGSFEDAFAIWNESGHCNLVTTDGDYISTNGIIHAGPWSETRGDLEVRQQIDEISIEVEPLKALRDELAIEQNQLLKNLANTKNQLQTIHMDLENQSKINLDLSRALEKLANSIEFDRQKLQEIQMRREKLDASANDIRTALATSEAERELVSKSKIEMDETIAGLTRNLTQSRDQYQKYVDELTEYQVKIASSLERLEGLRREYDTAEELLRNTQEEKIKNTALIERHLEEISVITVDLQKFAVDKEEKIVSFQAQETSNTELQTRHDLAVEELRHIENKIKLVRSQKENLMSILNDTRIKISEYTLRMENIRQQIQERYTVDMTEWMTSSERVQISDDQYSELKLELDGLKEKIAKFGNVNLAAIEEVDQLKERFEFLTNQRDDLEKSLQSLVDAIKKINKTTREMFEETFNNVNERFQQIFPRLFRGGKAKLMLTDPENILESGVDIFAQPPGKKLQNMNLLSGGEKALTAISLLFAIFEFKAPPFCVLDEVDAPLDDANVLRFVSIVKEMSQKTQFIVITHNKSTMEMANNLYGVTMEEPGVSRTVSVRLHQDQVHDINTIMEPRSAVA